MDAQKVDLFLMMNSKFFEGYQIPQIRETLLQVDDSKWVMLQSMSFTDPVLSLIVSLFGGSLGIDRFILGDTGLGVAKLLTCGGFGIWTIIDWFIIMGRTREKNLEKFRQFIY
ncbi:MAG: TM2 domain-containing protein [Bacteroidales bacterium]|nr:TM2 domain-containing protein [Bacteroidales bacterium]